MVKGYIFLFHQQKNWLTAPYSRFLLLGISEAPRMGSTFFLPYTPSFFKGIQVNFLLPTGCFSGVITPSAASPSAAQILKTAGKKPSPPPTAWSDLFVGLCTACSFALLKECDSFSDCPLPVEKFSMPLFTKNKGQVCNPAVLEDHLLRGSPSVQSLPDFRRKELFPYCGESLLNSQGRHVILVLN